MGRYLFLLILLAILVAVAVVVVKHKPANKTTTGSTGSSKRDVPVLTYGVANGGDIPQYPIHTVGSAFSVEVNAQLYEGLVGYQAESKIVPLLATNWSNPDNATWVFNLRHNVKFHTGRTMTADDVKYTLDYAVAHQGDDGGSSVLSVASSIKNITINNPYQVTIKTDGPDPVLLSKLSFLGIVDSKATAGSYMAGTGPYVLKTGVTPSATAIDLAAADNYWGGHVYTRELKITDYDSIDKLASDAAAGKVDLSGDFNTDQLKTIKDSTQTLSIPDVGTTFIGVNTEKPTSPLANKSAREAIADALNVPNILSTAKLKGTQASQLVPTLLPGHNPSINSVSYNVSKAKQLLAGVANASAQLSFGYPSSDAPQMTEIIKELTAAGLNIKGVPVDDFTTLINDATAGKYDLYSYAYTSSFEDGQDILSGVLQQNSDYSNPQIDDLLSQAGGTLDQADRIKLMQKVATIVDTDKPIIPLYTLDRQYALTKPYHITSDMPGMITGVYFWKVYQ